MVPQKVELEVAVERRLMDHAVAFDEFDQLAHSIHRMNRHEHVNMIQHLVDSWIRLSFYCANR